MFQISVRSHLLRVQNWEQAQVGSKNTWNDGGTVNHHRQVGQTFPLLPKSFELTSEYDDLSCELCIRLSLSQSGKLNVWFCVCDAGLQKV